MVLALSEHAEELLLDLDSQLCFALHSASRRVVRTYAPLLEELGLTYPQYLVMLVLWAWDRQLHALPTVTALGDRLDLDSGTLTPLLKRLEHKGLLTRERVRGGDEREIFLRVTDTGRAIKRQACTLPLKLLERSPFGLDELIALREQLKQLRGALSQDQAPEAALR